LIVIVISSGVTIYLNYTGSSFDPIKEISEATSGDYDHLLFVSMEYVDVE
jgi:hypothetical protein